MYEVADIGDSGIFNECDLPFVFFQLWVFILRRVVFGPLVEHLQYHVFVRVRIGAAFQLYFIIQTLLK